MIGAKEKMIPSMNKRRRVESASVAEDTSSFYKRLGLYILTPSSTSGLSQQIGLNTKNHVHQTCHTGSKTSNTAQRSDNGALQWVQSQQRDNQTNTARTSYTGQHVGSESVVTSLSQNVPTGRPVGGYQPTHRHGHDSNHAQHSNYGHWYQSNHANGHQSNHAHGNPSNHGHQSSQSYGHQSHIHGPQSTHSSEKQAHRAQTKTDFVNDGVFCWSRRDTLQIHDQSQPRFDRPVRKQPQVKPIDKYAPPDYLTIMYHPTPTLEDLGLTSYLDSPPSSPRAMSPVRYSEQSVTAAASKHEQTYKTTATSCKQTDAIATTSYKQTDTKAAGSKITDTLLPWKLIRITIPDEDAKPAVQLKGSHVGDPRLMFGRRSRGQLPKREDSVRVGQSQLPKREGSACVGLAQFANREGSVCDPRRGSAAPQPSVHQSLESQSSALTGPNDAKRKGPWFNTPERPEKKLCVWSTVAEQYVTESRQSDNQEARRDAAYRRYGSDGRPCMRQQSYDAERHQANIKYQTQPAREESYDEMLARERATHNERQHLKPGVQSLEHTNSVSSTLFTDSDNKVPQTSGPAVSMDLFGRMSPFSCWNRTAPEDPRFS
ncbi:uncharacterized protein LOC128160408 [Crassostrea angulata]|uniref:uncharacterized protein LOC128160408 n=1 Tax=Magallana angulata TaxID=2784310 RepID=UPI0022B0A047|nr:uncharacterized protein LOC128160408 [Crassostrea angulata]